MPSILHLMVFGAQSAREQAKNLLENQPHIKRIDLSADLREMRLFCQSTLTECEMIELLASSGVDGFKMLPDEDRAADQKSSRKGFPSAL